MLTGKRLDRVAVTGATGFLGGHLVRRLVRMGVRPLLLARSLRPTACLAGLEACVEWEQVDVTDPVRVSQAIDLASPTTIFHLAGTRGSQADGSALACARVNVLGTAAVLTAARQANVQRVVMVGTADVFGNRHDGPLHEELPLSPMSLYASSSAAACYFAQALHRAENCPVVILRPFSVYGPHQPSCMFVAQAVRCALDGLPFAMTEGTQQRDLVHVSDVVEALVLAAVTPGIEGRVIHIGSGQTHRLRDIAALIWRLSGSSAELGIGQRPAAAVELHDTWADVRLANMLLGWMPRVSLESGLERTIHWAREQVPR